MKVINLTKVDRYIYRAPLVYIGDAFYVFGGSTDISSYDTTIGRLNADLFWSKVGRLNIGRHSHNVIYDDHYVLVVGGFKSVDESDSYLPTERCIVSTSGVNCTEQNPLLSYYADYPELFIVPTNFCKKQT